MLHDRGHIVAYLHIGKAPLDRYLRRVGLEHHIEACRIVRIADDGLVGESVGFGVDARVGTLGIADGVTADVECGGIHPLELCICRDKCQGTNCKKK